MAVGGEKMLSKTGDKGTMYDTVQYSACEIESSSKESGKCIDLKYLESRTENEQSGEKNGERKEREGGGKIRKEKSHGDSQYLHGLLGE